VPAVALFDQYLTGNKPEDEQPTDTRSPAPANGATGNIGVYGINALAGETQQLANSPEGTRNDGLNRAAYKMGQLIGGGLIDADTVRTALADAARAAHLPQREIDQVLRDNPTSAINQGIQHPRQPQPQMLLGQVTYTETVAGEIADLADIGQDQQHTTWHTATLGETMHDPDHQQTPTHLQRDDGQALFYPGHVNGLLGESESGKGWVSLYGAGQALAGGETVLLLDFEDTPEAIHQRMVQMGYTDEQLTRFHYAHPDEPLTGPAVADFAAIVAHRYGMIIVDGVNAAMTLLGMELNDNTDATRFATLVLRPLAASGACVVTVDHVPKNLEARGKGGIGAQAKRAMLDGCALTVTVAEPFGVGQSGTLHLTVDKDRHGHIRGIAGQGDRAGTVHIDSVAGTVRIHISGPLTQQEITWQPTVKMAEISKALQDMGPLSFRQLKQLIVARDDTIRAGLAALIAGGYIHTRPGGRGAILHTSVRPYHQPEEGPEDG
jgi:hypothetical protein